ADLALCNYLAFFCGPGSEERIAELFAQSGLFRPKWQREDYRRRTIAKALDGRTEFYTGGWRLFANYTDEPAGGDGDEEPDLVKVGKPVVTIGEELAELSEGWPKRVGPLLFALGTDYEPLWLGGSEALFAWVGRLLGSDGANPVRWAGGTDKVTRG